MITDECIELCKKLTHECSILILLVMILLMISAFLALCCFDLNQQKKALAEKLNLITGYMGSSDTETKGGAK